MEIKSTEERIKTKKTDLFSFRIFICLTCILYIECVYEDLFGKENKQHIFMEKGRKTGSFTLHRKSTQTEERTQKQAEHLFPQKSSLAQFVFLLISTVALMVYLEKRK